VTKRIALVFAGDPDSAAFLKRVQETLQKPVVAVVADLGQSEDAAAISRKATQAGADQVVFADLKDEFAKDFVFPALKAGAAFAPSIGASLARALVSKTLVKVSKSSNAEAVGFPPARPDDALRSRLPLRALAPELEVLEAGAPSDPSAIAADSNLMQAGAEGGALDDPWAEPPAELFKLTADPAQAPEAAESVEIEFVDGVPTAVNKDPLGPSKLVIALNRLAGRHGVGREDAVENRASGLKVRRVVEAPGLALLRLAHAAVESLALDVEVGALRAPLGPKLSALATGGLWYSPEAAALRALSDETQKGVNGVARIRLHRGFASVTGRRGANSLYNAQLSGGPAAVDVALLVRATGQRLALNKSLRKGL
jgi:argininosuccinate synthase